MSMISAQCEVLRDVADELAKVTNGIRSGVPASTWHGMTYVFDNAAHRLCQAADTIWELRCKLVDQSEEIKRLEVENDKLREMVDGLTWCCEHYSCRQECPLYDVSEPDHCREVSIKRELGIEVDDDD